MSAPDNTRLEAPALVLPSAEELGWAEVRAALTVVALVAGVPTVLADLIVAHVLQQTRALIDNARVLHVEAPTITIIEQPAK